MECESVHPCVIMSDQAREVLSQVPEAFWQKVTRFIKRWKHTPHAFELPRRDLFTPGLYTRQVFMPAGSLVISRVHLTEHPFILSAGAVMVWDPYAGVRILRAPYTGVTKPGTIRLLFILRDAVWTTFHATTHTDPETVEKEITLDPTEMLGYLESKHEPCLLEQ